MSGELESLLTEYFAAFRGGVALAARVQKFMVTHALDTLKVESVEEVENMSSGAFVASVAKCPGSYIV